MVGFEYVGKSTATIIDTPLILVSTGQEDSIIGSARSKVEGEITISRPVTNEYGTTHDPLSFTYSLMKMDGETFTREEQVTIERWLSSPKLSSELKITDCEDNTYLYYGLFTNTEWVIGNGDFMLCTFTFQVNGRHCYKEVVKEYSGEQHEDIDNPGIVTSILNPYEFNIYCESDELEEYVYPIIEVQAYNMDYDTSFTLTNLTDNEQSGKYAELKVTSNSTSTIIVIDCQHCRIGQYVDSVFDRKRLSLLKYKDLGLQDVGNIYWPRLLPGNNTIKIIGNVKVKFIYKYPYKKVGGWLI